MVGQRQGHGVHLLRGENLSHVEEVLGLGAFRFLDQRHGTFARSLVHVAHGHDAAIRIELVIEPNVVSPSAAQSDYTELHPIISTENGELRRSQSRCAREETSTIHHY
jgi:hypothetical protein